MAEDAIMTFLSNSASDMDHEAEARFNDAISRYFDAEFALVKGRDTEAKDANQKADLDGNVPPDLPDEFDFFL